MGNGRITQPFRPVLSCCHILRDSVSDEIALSYPGEEHDAVQRPLLPRLHA
jgi:hypothetical protein